MVVVVLLLLFLSSGVALVLLNAVAMLWSGLAAMS
jgi:hypothetical protein